MRRSCKGSREDTECMIVVSDVWLRNLVEELKVQVSACCVNMGQGVARS